MKNEIILPSHLKVGFNVTDIYLNAESFPQITGFVYPKDIIDVVPYLIGDDRKYDVEINLLATLRE